jgi:hypothetical protein
MATVNKDFKIKSGLIVEGTTATVNGHNILTESTSGDQYILNLTGGATLVKSVSSEFDVSQGGELSIDRGVVDAYYDAAGDAAAALADANTYTDNQLYPQGTQAFDSYGAASTAEQNANTYTNNQLYPQGAQAFDSYGSATTAENNAKAYADGLIDDASNASNEVWSAYKTSTEIGLAQAAAETYAATAVSNLVDGAPGMLDTLNELAAALQDNPDVITNIQDVAAGKQNTLTAGNGIDIVSDTISVDPFDLVGPSTADYFTLAVKQDKIALKKSELTAYTDTLYDATGAAATAEQNAKDYADDAINVLTTDAIEEGLNNQYFTNQRGLDAAAQLLTQAETTNITISGTGNGLTITAENGVADSTTSDLAEGSNLYFTDSRALGAISGSNIQPESLDITWVRREEATWTGVATASTATVHSFGTNKGSVKYLVRVISGGNSHVTELLATTDQNNNVAVVEYGTIYTSLNPLATATVEWNAVTSQYDLNVTTANNNSEVLVAATLLSYND